VVTHFHSLEHTLDYSFSRLGIHSDIESPLVFVEPLGNPSYCR
jgi:actin-related protein 5